MFGGQAVTWTLTAVTLALLPRYLGPADMGRIGIGMAFAQLTMTIAGLGIATLVTREVARRREAALEIVATAFWLSVVLGTLGSCITLGISMALGYETLTWVAIAVFAATVPFDLLMLFGFGVLQGFEVMRYHAIWDVANKLFLLTCLAVVVAFDLGLPVFLAASFLSSALPAVAIVRLMRRFAPFSPGTFSFRTARWVIAESVPIGAVNVVLIVYLGIDVILLSRLGDEAASGLYAAPMRLFGTMLFAPTILMTVLFPRMAATALSDDLEFSRISGIALKVLTGVTVVAAVFAVFPGRIVLVDLFGSEFRDSGPVFAMMAVALVPTSINIFAHRVLVATNRQRVWTVVMAGALLLKVALDFALIPLLAATAGNAALGAAIALVVAEAAIMTVALVMLPPAVRQRAFGSHMVRLAAVAGIAAGTMYLLGGRGFLVMTGGGILVYVAAALLLRVYSMGELVAGARALAGAGNTRRAGVPDPAVLPGASAIWPGARMKANREAAPVLERVPSRPAALRSGLGYAVDLVPGPHRARWSTQSVVANVPLTESRAQAGEIFRN